jgi:hypothetical protein
MQKFEPAFAMGMEKSSLKEYQKRKNSNGELTKLIQPH